VILGTFAAPSADFVAFAARKIVFEFDIPVVMYTLEIKYIVRWKEDKQF